MNDMDAQNAPEPDKSKPTVASPHRRRVSLVDSKSTSALASSTSQTKNEKPKSDPESPSESRQNEPSADRDSDAETIVLPGKDGHSPSKVRKVRQEDKSDTDADAPKQRDRRRATMSNEDGEPAKKKKRISGSLSRPDRDVTLRSKESGSSGLSSAPTSPHRRRLQRRRSDAAPADSSSDDSDDSVDQGSSFRDKSKSERRRLPKIESDEEGDGRKARRHRLASAGVEGRRASRDYKSGSRSHHDRYQSTSPPPRHHRRSASTQLSSYSSNGLAQKKKRVPPPLQPTDYHSDDSSTSGSPHPRNAKLRSLATPSNTESNISPAKVGPHKKHLDAHGQTLLARACARGEYDGVKQRLLERPEDLNVADYAGNTPLQIAAINGCEDIVKLLIDAGCSLDCVNYDKETPLLDAVDNGHLGVVTLLLEAGVNPRKANVNGEEPIDRVTDETENAAEIRKVLMDARKKAGERQRTSEDRHSHQDYHDARDSHAPESPRHSPAAAAHTGRRGGTVRSTKTRNDLLYMPLDDKTLRQAAGRGDEETVARILQVKEGFDDPESMVAAARGGHDLVIQLLLGLGGANADPGPVSSLPGEFATPILAAIGQENIKVVELLLEQQGFDPTRRFQGETYYEIARRRQGTNWKEEEHLLKNSYDEYKRSRKDSTTKSPAKRDRGRDEKRSRREDAKADIRQLKQNASSPSRESDHRKKLSSSKLTSPSAKKRSESFSTHGDDENRKRGPGRPKKEDRHVADRESSPRASLKQSKSKRIDSDAAANSSDGESSKPRRKLVSKGELSRERDKIGKRSSMTKEPAGSRDLKADDSSDKPKLSQKYHDRTKALKRDESREVDTSGKRHRNSVTPDRPSDVDKDDGEAPVKRRRIDGETAEKRGKQRSASNDGYSKSILGKSSSANGKRGDGQSDDDDRERRHSGRSNPGDNAVQIKSEDVDVAMPDATPAADSSMSKHESIEDEPGNLSNIQKADKREAEAKKAKEAAEAAAAEEEKRKQQEENEARKAQEEADRKQRETEEAEKRKQEEEKRKQEEEERKKREEEERLRREQLEREAEEARRQREEEERKERERREKAHREELERKRAAREAEARRVREEQERARLDRLPPLLQWLQLCPNPKSPVVAEKLRFMPGLRYDTIRQTANGTAEGRELWLLNVQVALLLGEKDTDLARYTAWERVPVTQLAKASLWKTEWARWSLLDGKLWDLGRHIPGYYGDEEAASLSFETKKRLKAAAWDRFLATDMFFVKLSDFLYTVPNIPHLRNLELGVEYRELAESEADLHSLKGGQKWRQDPDADRFAGHAPRYRYFVNGCQVGEDLPIVSAVSSTPFPEKRVPRRGGLIAVLPGEADYERLAVEQGLEHLVQNSPKGQQLPNGFHSSSPTQPLPNGTNGHAITNNGEQESKTSNGLNGPSK